MLVFHGHKSCQQFALLVMTPCIQRETCHHDGRTTAAGIPSVVCGILGTGTPTQLSRVLLSIQLQLAMSAYTTQVELNLGTTMQVVTWHAHVRPVMH